MKNARPRSRNGFTLVEVMLAIGLSAVILAGFTAAIMVSQRSQSNLETVSTMEVEAHEAVQRIVDDLRQTSTTCPAWSLTSDLITYNLCSGSSAGVLTWENAGTLMLSNMPGEDITDGIDNNGNGLTDEGRVIWTNGFFTTGVVADVAPDGLLFTQSGNDVTISLTLTRLNQDGVSVSVSASTLVSLRN